MPLVWSRYPARHFPVHTLPTAAFATLQLPDRPPWYQGFWAWDGHHYLFAAQHGLQHEHDFAFFPLWPACATGLSLSGERHLAPVLTAHSGAPTLSGRL